MGKKQEKQKQKTKQVMFLLGRKGKEEENFCSFLLLQTEFQLHIKFKNQLRNKTIQPMSS